MSRTAVAGGLGLACALLVVACGGSQDGGGTPSAKPNFVVVMTDDQTLDDLRFMPQTRTLVSGAGVDFRNFIVSYSTCCPSRATFLTGQYAHNHGVEGNFPPLGGYGRLDKRKTLPVWLQRAGYETIHIGKYLNGYGVDTPPVVPPGWSQWFGAVGEKARLYWGYVLNENGRFHRFGRPQVENPRLYQTDVYSRIAQREIERFAGHKPFFLNVWFLAPHAEGPYPGQHSQRPRPAPRDRGRFDRVPLPRPPSYNEPDVRDKPSFIRRLAPIHSVPALTARYRARISTLAAVDDAVAGIVATLKRTGQLDNTYIVFTSDNGFFNGEHRIARGKELPYEPSIRLPLLVRGPGIKPGSVSQELVANTDFAPTIAALAGARPTLEMDGRSLLPFAEHPSKRTNRPIELETLVPGPTQRALYHDYRGVRTQRYMYAEYASGARELYDLKRDPYELHNVALYPSYAEVRARLAKLVRRLRDCRGAGCR